MARWMQQTTLPTLAMLTWEQVGSGRCWWLNDQDTSLIYMFLMITMIMMMICLIIIIIVISLQNDTIRLAELSEFIDIIYVIFMYFRYLTQGLLTLFLE
jgi:hypothetical protein